MTCDPTRPALHSVYSNQVIERAGLEPFVVRELRARRGYEGPQVLLSWRSPERSADVAELRVLRRFHDFPAGPDDGKVLYSGPAAEGRLADLDLVECRPTYYAAFSLRRDTGEWVTLPGARAEVVPLRSGLFAAKLMALLPELYLVADKKLERGGTGRIALERRTAGTTREVFNLFEDGRAQKGQLARFLKIFAAELDLVKGLIDCLPHQIDVDETYSHYLPYIAALVGLDLNRELPIPKQREEIKGEVEVYKLKGTTVAIAAKTRMITGFPVEVEEWSDNLLITNRPDRTSADFRPEATEHIGLPGDRTSYVIDSRPGADHACGRLGVYVEIPRGEPLPRPAVEKLARVLPQYTPSCARAKPIFLDPRYVDAYERGRLAERHRSEVIDRPREESVHDLCWLIANDPRRLTNSHFRSAAPGVACGENWYDRVEVRDLVVDDVRTLRWLLTNDPRRPTNSRFRTAGRITLALDAWSDEATPLSPSGAAPGWLLASDPTRHSNSGHVTAS